MKYILTTMAVPMLLAAGCGGSPTDLPDTFTMEDQPDIIVTGDSVFMLSPYDDSVVKVTPGSQTGTAEEDGYTDLETFDVENIGIGQGPQGLIFTPDKRYILSLTHGEDTDGLAILAPSATCTGERPVDATCVTTLDARPLHDTLVLSPDGRFAVSYISEESASQASQDVINLNEIGVYDLDNRTVLFATLGFSPKGFAFTHAESPPRMVAITETKVVVLDLETGETTQRELAGASDSQLRPDGVVVTGDDHYALMTLEASSDLFTFDLTQPNLPINIINLGMIPRQIALSATGNETLVISTTKTAIGVIHQEDLSVDVYELEQRVTEMLSPEGSDYAVFYDATGVGRDLYYLDLEQGRMVAYYLENPCVEVHASPGGDALVLYYEPEPYSTGGSGLASSFAVAILNLAQGDRQPNPILVRTLPPAIAFHLGADPSQDQVFAPFQGSESGTVGSFNLSSYDSMAIDVAPMPYAIGILSDDRVVVAHQAALGFLSVFPVNDPDLVQFVHGFLAGGLM